MKLSTAPNLRYSTATNNLSSNEEEEMNKLLNESMKDNCKTLIINNNLIREINYILGNTGGHDEIIPKLKHQLELIRSFKLKDEVIY